MQTRVICCELRSLLQNQRFSRPVRQSQFTSTRPTPTLLRLISPQHSTPNRKKRSTSSSVRTGTSFHENLLTCQVYPGGWLSIVYESTQKQNLSKNIFDGPPSRREKPFARRWLGSWQQSLSERFTTPSGSPMLSWSPRRTSHFACALISNISIEPTRKIIFLSLASTKLSTRLRGVSACLP